MSERILIIGADSFTGQHLTQNFTQHGYSLTGTGRYASAEHIALDLMDADAVNEVVRSTQPDYIINLAAISFVASEDTVAFYELNTIGPLNLMQAISAHSSELKKLVLASSANVYGTPPSSPVSESSPIDPINHYGASKASMEIMARQFFDRIPTVVTRPFNYTGPGQAEHFLIPKIVAAFARRADKVELGNTHVRREFNDVRWVCEVYRSLLTCDCDSQMVNICTGSGYSIDDVISMLTDLTGHNLEVVVNPDFVRENEIEELVGDDNRLNSLTGPLERPTLQQTLALMLNTYENAG